MPAWVAPAIGAGIGALGSLFSGKDRDVEPFDDFYRRFRSEYGPEEFGLSSAEYASAYGRGAREIQREREVSTFRGLERLRRSGLGRSTAAATLGLQSGARAEQNFARMVLELAGLNEQVARQQKNDLFSQGAQAYGLNLQGIQLEENIGAQNQQAYGGFIRSITDPVENYFLLKDLESMEDLFRNSPTPFGGGSLYNDNASLG